MSPNAIYVTLILTLVGWGTGVPLWYYAMRSHGRTQRLNRDILRALETQTNLLIQLTATLRLEQPLRVQRTQRQALILFLVSSGLFTRREQRDRLLEDLPGALVANIERQPDAQEDINTIVICVLKWGRKADFDLLLDNTRFCVKGIDRLAEEFSNLCVEQGWV